MNFDIIVRNYTTSTIQPTNENETQPLSITWLTIAAFSVTIALILIIFLLYKLCTFTFCDDDRQFGESKKTVSVAKLSDSGRSSGSKSVAVIVKIPSLAESSVVGPAELLTPARSSSPEGLGIRSMTNLSLRGKTGSKSLKLSECRVSDTKGKMSIKGSFLD